MLTFSLSLLLIVLEQFCINFCKFNVTIAMMKMEWLAFHYTGTFSRQHNQNICSFILHLYIFCGIGQFPSCTFIWACTFIFRGKFFPPAHLLEPARLFFTIILPPCTLIRACTLIRKPRVYMGPPSQF